MIAGHCEAEAASACLVREAYEEAGLVVDPADFELVHTVHMREQPADPPRIQLFFRARRPGHRTMITRTTPVGRRAVTWGWDDVAASRRNACAGTGIPR
ncbi:NUDIX domain-containing protein [Streptomyces sp. NPDC048718]|uniref:NUDIX domain-containing protein n=1 Tax=Streptomyces sp. NPDC048718 TaxID=3365587 RepID=UPI00371A7DC8